MFQSPLRINQKHRSRRPFNASHPNKYKVQLHQCRYINIKMININGRYNADTLISYLYLNIYSSRVPIYTQRSLYTLYTQTCYYMIYATVLFLCIFFGAACDAKLIQTCREKTLRQLNSHEYIHF